MIGVRYAAVAFGGAMAGLGGAYFSLVLTPMWAEELTAGRGWIALALVVFAAWRPWRLLAGAYLFGAVMTFELHAKAAGITVVAAGVPGGAALPRDHPRAGADLDARVGRRQRRRPASASRSKPDRLKTNTGEQEMTHDLPDAALLKAGGAAAALPLLGGRAFAQEPLKVGFVYLGPIGDYGWTYAHDQGRQAGDRRARRRGRDHLSSRTSPRAPDSERVIRDLADDGNKLIFTTSFGYMDPTIKVAKRFPDVKFEHCTGYQRADNVATYNARFHEGRAVCGTIAGHDVEDRRSPATSPPSRSPRW